MRDLKRTPFLMCLAALSLCAVKPANSQEIQRLSATFRFFGSEKSTTLKPLAGGAGGATIFSRTVTVPAGVNVLYVTMSTTGDTHFSARSTFTCRVGTSLLALAACQPGAGNPSGEAPLGWITLQRHRDYNRDYAAKAGVVPFAGDGAGGAGDLHDNSIHYQWCVRVPFSELPYTRVVQ